MARIIEHEKSFGQPIYSWSAEKPWDTETWKKPLRIGKRNQLLWGPGSSGSKVAGCEVTSLVRLTLTKLRRSISNLV